MPVWKFRTIEEMPPTPSYDAGSEEHMRRWAALWARATALANKRFKSGVFKFRAIEDSQRANPEATEPPRS